jgi:hypothetical protein
LFFGGALSSQSQSHIATDGQSVSMSWCRAQSGAHDLSTVTLPVVGGDEKRRLKSETVKYGREYQGTRAQERLRCKDQQHIQKIRPLVREGAPQKQDRKS